MRTCYDELAAYYHLIFADWNHAIARQAAIIGPFLEQESNAGRQLRVLDCACGIGTQSLGLAQRGHNVTGCDLSAAAIERARHEASARNLQAHFLVADMRELSAIPESNFDALICFDNSLPHLESFEQLYCAATQFRSKLRSGGIFIASIRDYDRLVDDRPAMQPPNFYMDGRQRRIVHQLWDWIDELRYTFHLYITHEIPAGWECHHFVSTYRALLRNELTNAIQSAGFVAVRWLLPAETGFYQPIVIAKASS